MKFGNAVAVLANPFLQIRPFTEHSETEGQQAHSRLLTAGEEVGGDECGVPHLGDGAIGEGGGGQAGEDVVARLPAAILDVVAEPVIEELERLVGDLPLVDRRHPLPEEGVIGLGHALEVGDDGECEGFCIGTDHLARNRPR